MILAVGDPTGFEPDPSTSVTHEPWCHTGAAASRGEVPSRPGSPEASTVDHPRAAYPQWWHPYGARGGRRVLIPAIDTADS